METIIVIMKSKYKPLIQIALLLSLLCLFFCCENPDKTSPCFGVTIETECHDESTRSFYDVSSKEYQRITSYLQSYDPDYFKSEECIYVAFKTIEGANVNGYFESHFACD